MSLDEMVLALDDVNFVYINHKIMHEGWILSMQVRILLDYINKGRMFHAIRLFHYATGIIGEIL